jgi:hypothetical protein
MMNTDNFDWYPCRFLQYKYDLIDPRFGLTFNKFEPTQPLLEEAGFEANGYTWSGVVKALIQANAPEHIQDISYDPESSMFCVNSSKLDALKEVHHWIGLIHENPMILTEILDTLDPETI